jgi:hypothetical protein
MRSEEAAAIFKKHIALAVPATILLSLYATSAGAQPLGGHTLQVSNSGFVAPFNVLVGPGVEVSGLGGVGNIDLFDINATSAGMTLNVGIESGFADAPNRIRFEDIEGSIPDIVNVTLNAAGTSHPNAGANRINFGKDFFEYEFGGLSGGPGSIALDISFAAMPPTTVPVSNGVHAGSFVRDCRSSTALTAPDRCMEGNQQSFVGTVREIRESSYPGAIQAGVLTSNSLARTSGIDVTGSTVEASGDAFQPPQLRLGVFTSTNYARVSTGVLSVQGYSWDGSGAAARSLSLGSTFSGSFLIDSDPSPTFNPEAVIWGSIRVFSLATATFNVEEILPANPTPGGCYFAPGFLWNCLQARGDFRLEAEDNFGGSDTAGDVAFALEPGRYYFTWVYAAGIARFGAWLDARNTVVTTWNDTTGLTAAAGEIVPISAVVDWLASLRQSVTGVGPGKSLADKVTLAQTYYAVPDVPATCAALTDFVSQVKAQAGNKKLTTVQAAKLKSDAQAIMAAIGCN